MLWAPYQIAETFCSVDSTFFPFDAQTCHYTLMTWTYPSSEVLIKPILQDTTPMVDSSISSEWALQETTADHGLAYDADDFENEEYW